MGRPELLLARCPTVPQCHGPRSYDDFLCTQISKEFVRGGIGVKAPVDDLAVQNLWLAPACGPRRPGCLP